MLNKDLLLQLTIVLAIFMLGFILRAETINLHGISIDEKSFYQDDHGLPYFYELDSYYNYRLTHNFLDHGYLGDEIIDGREWDLHSYYPPGVPLDYPPLIVYLTAFLYRVVNFFSNVPLHMISFWLPSFIAPLAGVIAYFFTRRFTNELGALAAGILTVMAPFYFTRTVPGWFDTDMFNIMFPLLIVWIFTEAVMIKNLKKSLTLSILAGIVMFLFSTAWNGWQYLFYIIFAFNVLYILWCKIKGRNILPLILILSIFISTTILLIVFCTGSLNLINVLQGPIELFRLSNSNNIWSPWPDVYTSVSELKKPSFTELVGGFGVLLLGGIFGFFWTGRFLSNENLKNRYLKKMNWDFYIFLVIWSIIGFFSLTKGVRFIILVIPPLIISTGILIGICVEYLNNLKNFPKFAIFRKYPNFLKFISLIFVLIVCLPTTFNACYNFHIRSIVNDDVASAADWINKETPNETVIILEWSYGHFFSARADRPVIFDGRMAYIETLPIREYDSAYLYNDKSPNPSRDYWISRAFSTTNENLSIGIFRMLASSGDMAYLTLDNYIQNTTKTVLILNDILSSDKTSAKKLLLFKYNLDESQTQNVLKFTHPEKPMHYVIITTSDMANLGKSTFNTGNWDFNQLKPGNYTYSVGIFNTSEDTMNTTNEVFINLKNEFVSWKNKTPYMVTIIDNGLIKKHNMDENSNFVVVILMDEKKAIVMDKKFEKSMFTKMVLERSGGKYFKPLFQNKEVVIWEPKI